jgi:D-alanyl-D-alanine carboxypeptidase/D-alanyl-D-alanine-endopeptidase (penicillin-binding protein 4)
VLAVALVLAGAAVLASAGRAPADPWREPKAAPSSLGSPMLAPRRAPAVFLEEAAAAALRTALAPILAPHDGCVVVRDDDGIVVRIAGDRGLAGASTTKVLTAAAALDALGADHRFTTRALTAAPVPRPDGRLAGDLHVVGGGDPVLSTPGEIARLHADPQTATAPVTPLDDLAAAIASTGITHIDGAIVADDSRHDPLRYLPDWKPNYRTDGEIGPLGALAVDDGFADPAARVPAADPAALTAERLVQLLRARGVSVAGGVRTGPAPAGAREVAAITSPPVREIVEALVRESDNYTGEILVRELGAAHAGTGTTEAGLRVVVARLARLGVPVEGLALRDGSGLAPTGRVTCDSLARVVHLARRGRLAPVDAGLAVAGRTGTLADRHTADPLTGVLRAKTGQIDGVAGLTGVIDDAEHLRFAYLANGDFSESGGHDLQDAVASAIAAYPVVPDADRLVPGP